jgi:uncharacterized protein (TIGR02421 family)
MTAPGALAAADLAVDRALADVAGSFRFLLDLTPVDLVAARQRFDRDGVTPDFKYRPLADDPAVSAQRLADVDVDAVEDPTLASLLMAKAREVGLQLEMLACRGTRDFLTMSIELYGAVSPGLMTEAEAILDGVPASGRDDGPCLDADRIAAAAQLELDHYRTLAPDIETHVEVREGSTGLMVSNGVLLIAPTSRVSATRIAALLQHEIGVHVVTHVNGANQPLHVLATGLAGHDETQEGLAVLAEHLVGGLDAARLRQLAARVVAVHQMLEGAEFPEVHRVLVDAGVPRTQAFTITTRVFRSGGLTKDAVYLRGLRDLVDHLAAGHELDVLWLGKMPLEAVPLVAEMHRRGALVDPLLRPRFLDDPVARDRLAAIPNASSLASLIGDPP